GATPDEIGGPRRGRSGIRSGERKTRCRRNGSPKAGERKSRCGRNGSPKAGERKTRGSPAQKQSENSESENGDSPIAARARSPTISARWDATALIALRTDPLPRERIASGTFRIER